MPLARMLEGIGDDQRDELPRVVHGGVFEGKRCSSTMEAVRIPSNESGAFGTR